MLGVRWRCHGCMPGNAGWAMPERRRDEAAGTVVDTLARSFGTGEENAGHGMGAIIASIA